jgi:hypothetical protein
MIPAPRSLRRVLLLLALLAAFGLHIHREQKVDPELAAAFEVLDVGSDAAIPRAPMRPSARLATTEVPKVLPERVTGPSGEYEVAAGELLVRLRTGAAPDQVQIALRHAGARWIRKGAPGLWRVGFDRSRPVDQLTQDVRDVTADVTVRPNAVVRGASCGPGDLVGLQWERPMVDGNASCPDAAGLPDVVVAILDTGVA